MGNYYAWMDNKNIVISSVSDMIPTGDPMEYELETASPYIDKEATIIKLYGNGSAPLLKKEIDNMDLNPNLYRDGKRIVFKAPAMPGSPYYDLYMNMAKILRKPKFIQLRKKKSIKPKTKRNVCRCKK
jgi:hypothetical protein